MLRLKNPEAIRTSKTFNLSDIRMTEAEFVDYVLTYVKASLTAELPDVYMIIVYVVYAVLFIFGIVGNVWVIRAASNSLLLSVPRRRNASTSSIATKFLRCFGATSSRSPTAPVTAGSRSIVPRVTAVNRNVIVYVLALSVADSCVLLTAPMLICALTIKRWVFGGVLCKFYYVAESYNKFLSVYLLVALSCDRYVSVCRPMTNIRFWQCAKRSTPIALMLVITITLVLIPIYIYAEQNFDEIYIPVNNETALIVELAECSLKLSDVSMATFTWCVFAFGFCLPGACVLYFYVRILTFIYYHSKSLLTQNTRLPLKRLTLLTLAIVFFYFSCWTPYWAGMIYGQITWSHVEKNSAIFFVLHTLVYLNSSANWVLYAFLNKNIRSVDNHHRRPPLSGAASTNFDGRSPQLEGASVVRFRALTSLSLDTTNTAPLSGAGGGESTSLRRIILANKKRYDGARIESANSSSVIL